MKKQERRSYFDRMAAERDSWKKKNCYYYNALERIVQFHVPPGAKVLEIGCGTGDLLQALKPSRAVGIDISSEMVQQAKSKYPFCEFYSDDIEDLKLTKTFDYVLLSDLIGHLNDIWSAFSHLRQVTTPECHVIITHFNHLWQPLLNLAERWGLMMRQGYQNWLSASDLKNLLMLTGFEVLKTETHLLIPKYIPIFSYLANRFLARMPFLRHLCLVQVLVARRQAEPVTNGPLSCSIIIPCRNERGNIENCVKRTPVMGKTTEIIFVDGNSQDGTVEKIKEYAGVHGKKTVRWISQGSGRGKADAVRQGFSCAIGDVFMILDADLTVDPEELPRFFQALVERKGELIMGSRLIYPMEEQAMRILNYLGNKFFSMAFSWLLDQHIKDTLCGTKVLWKKDYLRIVQGRDYFGDFDPFGDFDLIFGASKLDLKIMEIPIHYRDRTYGSTKIDRWQHGWLLLRMCWIAMRRLKFYY